MVTTTLGVLVIVLGLICWLGQTLAVFAPRVAVKLGVSEPEEELDKSMYLFERYSQGIPDILLTWLLPASALMMLLDNVHWPILALVGGGVYSYFPSVFWHYAHRVEAKWDEGGQPGISAHGLRSRCALDTGCDMHDCAGYGCNWQLSKLKATGKF